MSRHVHASLYARVSFHAAASMMALQKALEGKGSAGRAWRVLHFKPSFGNPLLVYWFAAWRILLKVSRNLGYWSFGTSER